MKNLIFIDTETTGIPKDWSKNDHRIVQVAWMIDGKRQNYICNPIRPIEIGAMAIHHITDEMAADGFDFSDKILPGLNGIFKENILVAHNAPFDIKMLENEGCIINKSIDTLRVAKHLIPEAEAHNLQYLRYFLGLEFDEEINPHDAMSDVIVLKELFNYLCAKFVLENFSKPNFVVMDDEIIEKMVKLSNTPVLLEMINFGKHKGMKFSEVPKSYLNWLSQQPDIDDDLRYTLDFNLGKLPL